MEPTVSKTTVNSNKEALIRGLEFGFTKYFDWDFVPYYLKGFGFTGNYTYIDSKFAGSYALDMFGNSIANRLPMEGLSHHTANAQLMYDRDPISFRLAYNWRSKYLMLASGYNTSDSYKGSDSGITCKVNNNAAGGWGGNVQDGTCNYALPVWSKSFGSLDAGLDYSIDDNWKLSIQSQNLLNTKAKTTMGINMAAYTDATGVARPAQEEKSRGWFVADRRVSIDLRVNF
jgi:outer membrane receptor protein involved in Fe transport